MAGIVPVRGQSLPSLPVAARGVAEAGGGEPRLHPGPWAPRKRWGVRVYDAIASLGLPPSPGALSTRRLRGLGLRSGRRTRVHPERWPQEPASPRRVDPGRFRRALARLCPHELTAERAALIADATREAAREFDVDPFLLGALVYHQSRCGTVAADSWGIGLTRINLGMHRTRLQGGVYHFGVPASRGRYQRRTLTVDRYAPSPEQLRRPHPNLYFSAAFLRVFEQQCPHIDGAFHSHPHRHPVSHLVWGDVVRSSVPEDQIFVARRRLIDYYAPRRELRARYRHLELSSPLDGAPRVASGLMGDPRQGGRRVHAGIDLTGSVGEPVRAMAPGRVSFAGVELRALGNKDLAPERAARVPPGRMGPRGLYVRIDHGDGLQTLYVHLSEYTVRSGDRVARGERIGHVGRTGMHTSDAHLHLGIFDGDTVVDPLPHLQPLVITGDGIPVLDFVELQQLLAGARQGP